MSADFLKILLKKGNWYVIIGIYEFLLRKNSAGMWKGGGNR